MLKADLGRQELLEIACTVAAGGFIDYLNIIAGAGQDVKVLYKGFPSMYDLPAPFVDLAVQVKAAVGDLPVLHAGRVIDPILAEQLLAEGKVDLVGMTRAVIADPQMPNKARQGRLNEIRRCVGINQDCIDRLYFGKSITCSINPTIGRERDLADVEPAVTSKNVLVIGAGPAGLETARVAAERGHRVTLWERNDHLGGQLAIAACAPNRDDLAEFIRWQQRELTRLNVEVRLGVEATAASILAESPDAIVVATGARPHIPQISGVDLDHVVTAWDVLQDRVNIGDRVVVLDEEGQHQGLSTAELLMDKGKQVTVVTRYFYAGLDIGITTIVPLYERLFTKGIRVMPHSQVTAIELEHVTIENIYSGKIEQPEADTIVLAAGGRALDGLYHDLKGQVNELHIAGDCVAPRKLHHAILEGTRVARAL